MSEQTAEISQFQEIENEKIRKQIEQIYEQLTSSDSMDTSKLDTLHGEMLKDIDDLNQLSGIKDTIDNIKKTHMLDPSNTYITTIKDILKWINTDMDQYIKYE